MNNVPEGAQLSEDGAWWWDGADWQPVDGLPDTGGADAVIDLDAAEIPYLAALASYSPDESGATEYLATLGLTADSAADDGTAYA